MKVTVKCVCDPLDNGVDRVKGVSGPLENGVDRVKGESVNNEFRWN